MKRVRLGLVALGVFLPVLTGCGSGDSPPFAVSCTVHRLPTGMLRAAVKVTNSTSKIGAPILYGPVFAHLRHFYPYTLRPVVVHVRSSGASRSYPGFIVPGVSPKKPASLLLRFQPSPHKQPIVVTGSRTVQAGDASTLSNPDCEIGRT